MVAGFPLYTSIDGNNCTVFGGGEEAFRIADSLLLHGAKVTVIAPKLCDPLKALSDSGRIRHLPRKFFRGDCTNGQLCFSTTGHKSVDLAVVAECKAKRIPVCATSFPDYSTFRFPYTAIVENTILSLDGDLPKEKLEELLLCLQKQLEELLKQ